MKERGAWQRRPRVLIGLAALAVMTIGMYAVLRVHFSASDGYDEVAVGRGDIAESILSTGTVQPENRLEIKPPIAGRIDAVLVEEGQVVHRGQTLALMSSAERAALLDAARARGPQELKRWEEYYRPAPILAPIDGTIISRNVEPGQSFTSQDALFVMSDRLTVKAQVDETDIAKIRLHQPAIVTLDAYPNEDIPSRVDQIAYDATTVNNVTTYIVDVLPDEVPDFMRSGMTANVRFRGEERSGVLVLPSNAVRNRDGKHVVLLVPAGGGDKPQEREVETGITDGRMIEIVSGLAEGGRALVTRPKDRKNGNASGASSPLTPFRAPRGR